MADRSAILAALRGTKACDAHRPRDPVQWCDGCHEARADAVLAAIQPPMPAEAAQNAPTPTTTTRGSADNPRRDDGPCVVCDEPTDSLHGDFRLWPATLPHPDADAAGNGPSARWHLGCAWRRMQSPRRLPCSHPQACATTTDNPPHDGSTRTCAWCADRAGLLAELRDAQDDAMNSVIDCGPRRLSVHFGDAGTVRHVNRVDDAGCVRHDGPVTPEDALWLAGEAREALAAAQARAEHLATLVRDFAHSCACPEDSRPCRPFMHNDRTCETIAAALLPADTAALNGALRKARADALRDAARVAEDVHYGPLPPERGIRIPDDGLPSAARDHAEAGLMTGTFMTGRFIAARLRRMADDAEAG